MVRTFSIHKKYALVSDSFVLSLLSLRWLPPVMYITWPRAGLKRALVSDPVVVILQLQHWLPCTNTAGCSTRAYQAAFRSRLLSACVGPAAAGRPGDRAGVSLK